MPAPFGESAAAVIADALHRARAQGTGRIDEDHLFAALLANPQSRPMFAQLGGPDGADPVWADVRAARRRGGLTRGEQQALAGLGIDLDNVVNRVEALLGAGVLDDAGTPARRARRVSMSPEAIAILNAANRQKAARGARRVTARHLALGLLAAQGLFADALRARGITLAAALEATGGNDPDSASC